MLVTPTGLKVVMDERIAGDVIRPGSTRVSFDNFSELLSESQVYEVLASDYTDHLSRMELCLVPTVAAYFSIVSNRVQKHRAETGRTARPYRGGKRRRRTRNRNEYSILGHQAFGRH